MLIIATLVLVIPMLVLAGAALWWGADALQRLAALTASTGPSVELAVAARWQTLLASWMLPLGLGVCVGLGGLALGFMAWLGGRISRPLKVMAMAAPALVRDEPIPRLQSRLTEVRGLQASFHEAAAEQRQSEARLGLALAGGRLGWWELDLAARRLDTSTELRRSLHWSDTDDFDYRALVSAISRPQLRRAARAAIAASWAGADFDMELSLRSRRGEQRWLRVVGRGLIDESGSHPLLVGACIDISESKRDLLLLRDKVETLNCRIRGTLATAQSLAVESVRHAASLEEAERSIELRTQALDRALSILAREDWKGAELSTVVHEAVVLFGKSSSRRIRARGPQLFLSPRVAFPLFLVLHELATNAAIHGALLSLSGRVELDWEVMGQGANARLVLKWRERGGARLTALPSRRGLGSALIETALAEELKGHAQIRFEPEGASCDIEVPLSEATQKPLVAAMT